MQTKKMTEGQLCFFLKKGRSWVLCSMPIIPAFSKQRQEHHQFKVISNPVSKKKKKKRPGTGGSYV
jgi:hypothetical protein